MTYTARTKFGGTGRATPGVPVLTPADAGKVLTGAADRTAFWATPAASGSDAHYTEPFTNSTGFVLVHNLGKEATITVLDTQGVPFAVDIDHDPSLNSATLSWNGAMSGTASAN